MNFHRFVYWKLFAIYNKYSEIRLNYLIPNIKESIKEYQSKTESTGTKYSLPDGRYISDGTFSMHGFSLGLCC